MAHNTKARAEELLSAALDIVTPDVQADLDALANVGLGIEILTARANGDEARARELEQDPQYIERQRRLRALELAFRERTSSSHPTSRQYIAKALRLRRGERVRADNRGGARPGAGAPAGNDNRWRKAREEE